MNKPASCPKCKAPAPKITWEGGSPPFGPEKWSCDACGHEWTTPAALNYQEWRARTCG